jgi:hypothetical protein
MLRSVEHCHAVTHVLEGDTQFLLAVTKLIKKTRILHRDHGLRRKILQQCNLIGLGWAHMSPICGNSTQQLAVLAQRN